MLFRCVSLLAMFSLIYTEVSAGKLEDTGRTSQQVVPSGSGENVVDNADHQLKGHIPKVDHSKGVYMHDHPDFPSVQGGPGDPYRTHYLHAPFGIGHKNKRSTRPEEAMLKIFNIRLPNEEERL